MNHYFIYSMRIYSRGGKGEWNKRNILVLLLLLFFWNRKIKKETYKITFSINIFLILTLLLNSVKLTDWFSFGWINPHIWESKTSSSQKIFIIMFKKYETVFLGLPDFDLIAEFLLIKFYLTNLSPIQIAVRLIF